MAFEASEWSGPIPDEPEKPSMRFLPRPFFLGVVTGLGLATLAFVVETYAPAVFQAARERNQEYRQRGDRFSLQCELLNANGLPHPECE